MTAVRVKIDAPAGLIELEGDREFVSTFLDKLLPLVESAGLGFGVGNGANATAEGSPTTQEALSETQSEPPAKRKRRAVKAPPAGGSCRDRIRVLRTDGFFKDRRAPSDIVGGLAEKGWTHNVNQVSAAVGLMFKRGEIQRTKNTDGNGFIYFWDREEA